MSSLQNQAHDSQPYGHSQLQKLQPSHTERPVQLAPAHSPTCAAFEAKSPQLPDKKGSRAYRYLRWNFGSVYRRLFSLVFAANVAALVAVAVRAARAGSPLTYQQASDAVAANLLAALLVRNEHVVNALFLAFVTWPRRLRLPLPLRRLLAKVYSYGGIHSGGGVAATLWYVAFLTQLTRSYVRGGGEAEALSPYRCYVLLASYGIGVLLLAILIFAHPHLRALMHNWFEGVHRFLGWTVIVLFWLQVMLVAADAVHGGSAGASSQPAPSFGRTLAANATFWMLVLITLLVVYPWSRLRLRDVQVEPLSDHCVKLNFSYCSAHYGQAVRVSDAPLKETHAFATIPNPQLSPDLETGLGAVPERPAGLSNAGKKGFSIVISDAGDWTRKIIKNPPKKIYTRGVPQYGVLRVAGMFDPVIVIATGSGIAPCLSLFVEMPNHPVRIIWSAPAPLETFGQGIVNAVYASDPDAVVIDTRKSGRPDLVKIAYGIWVESRTKRRSGQHEKPGKAAGPCEAVVIISNQKVTRKVVYGLESRGVAAYGALFDS